ncbi:siroheme synthase middle domains-like protein [Tilletiaria anomala UBC 951]|uniref:precorrin-2 dehydrogenase n=1 Tax=Tilletiaria anomala (strain ATCC 24038 / CBS 436.72 / UBC 951) TaxID=1037660 RepID=A0A066W6S7_TILAU|nr:siroheme synthase middle domains-like protein [Tilletiaria anomala UBC 951]KDN46475.1 siroheme synthase middle domains-like protein [Tilletiaria anomala UBC 951]
MAAKEYHEIVPGAGLILSWQLKGKKVLLVGGGPVAAGRLVNVKDADAHLTVICPSSGLCGEMKHRIYTENVVDVYHDRLFGGASELDAPEDGRRFDMVLTAIDDAELSRSICHMARARKIPVNVADVPPECDFYFGSLIRRGPLQVMVSTGGKGPKIASQTRRVIERALPENIDNAIERVGKLRAKLREVAPEQKQGPKRMRWMIDVCEKWSLDQLSDMTDDDMEEILKGWKKGTVPTYRQVRGIKWKIIPFIALPTAKQINKSLFGTCPVVGAISPWLSGVLGATAGAAVASAFFVLRSQTRHSLMSVP